MLERLTAHCPMRALDESNLADYCTALEGVSHFHYVTWSAGCARNVSLLELELQAEVDKYASALSLLLAQRAGRFPGELFRSAVRAAASCYRTWMRRSVRATRKPTGLRRASASGWKSASCGGGRRGPTPCWRN